MKTLKTVTLPYSPGARARKFLDEYYSARNGASIDIAIGTMCRSSEMKPEDGEPAVIVTIDGSVHGFTTKEARALAMAGEQTMNKFTEVLESDASMPDLIMALRMAADKAEEELGDDKKEP